MLPKAHITLGILFVIVLYFIFPQLLIASLLIIFFSSFLIDVDHVFYYFLKTGKCSPFGAYKWYMKRRQEFHNLTREQKKRTYSGFYLFHGIEWLIVLFFASYSVPFFFFIFIGFSFHFVLDTIHEIYDKGTVHKISLIYNLIMKKKLEQ